MIKVTSLNKYYNKRKSNEIHVINNVNIELPDTGIVSFLGHSGSGKTTLLNVIGGLDKASGTISYDGVEMKNYQARKIDNFRANNIGYVFQNYNLLLEETVYDNLRIALELIGINDKEEVDKRIEYVLKAVGLFKARKKKAFALSGGQQQRVSIARALLKQCKILIADEPTGNLDSTNTIEVMNILKKISKNTLVLLVTHEENVANFYSDYIFRIADGKIISEGANESNSSISRDDSNIAYLKDMELNEGETSLGGIKIYSENGEAPATNLTFIFKNNTLYLKSDTPIKLVEESSIKIVDDHRSEIKQDDLESFNYDTSFYQDKSVKKNIFKELLIKLSDSYAKFRNVKKRVRFMYFALAAIGFVFAISVLSFENYAKLDLSGYPYSQYDTLIDTYYDDNKPNSALLEAYSKGYIDNLSAYTYNYFTFTESKTMHKNFTANVYGVEALFDEDVVTIDIGEKPSKIGELVVSRNIADTWTDKCRLNSVNDLIGKTITSRYYKTTSYTIVGITANDNNIFYTAMPQFLKDFANNTKYYANQTNEYYGSYKIEKNYYTVTMGRDIGIDSNTNEMLVSEKQFKEYGNQYLNYNGYEYLVVGAIKDRGFGDDAVYIVNNYNMPESSRSHYAYLSSSTDYKVVEGRAVENETEILTSLYSGLEIGSTIDGKTVVGKYIGNNMVTYSSGLLTPAAYFLSDSQNNDFYFKVKNKNEFNTILGKYGLSYDSSYNAVAKPVKEDADTTKVVFGVIFIVLFAISTLFIYFIMRSKMIADIQSLGIYRSLGMKRGKVINRYVSDSFVLSLFTTIIGYYVCVLGYTFIRTITSIISEDLLVLNMPITILGSFIILAISTFLGVLPVMLLVRLTPSEIMAKYDI